MPYKSIPLRVYAWLPRSFKIKSWVLPHVNESWYHPGSLMHIGRHLNERTQQYQTHHHTPQHKAPHQPLSCGLLSLANFQWTANLSHSPCDWIA